MPDNLDHLQSAINDVASFGACWVLGFAHRDGLIDRMPRDLVCAVSLATMAAGGWFALTFQTDEGYDLGEIPLAQALWSFGFVLLLLRFRPSGMGWLRRIRPLDWLVSAFNARAVTVYLWHEVALVVSVLVIDLMWAVPAFEDTSPARRRVVPVRGDVAADRRRSPAVRVDGGSRRETQAPLAALTFPSQIRPSDQVPASQLTAQIRFGPAGRQWRGRWFRRRTG